MAYPGPWRTAAVAHREDYNRAQRRAISRTA